MTDIEKGIVVLISVVAAAEFLAIVLGTTWIRYLYAEVRVLQGFRRSVIGEGVASVARDWSVRSKVDPQ